MDESDFSDGSEEEYEGKEEDLDPNNPDDYFPIMERDFNKILNEMEQNPEASQFADDYNKLFEAFYQSFTKQKELEGMTDEMLKDIQDKEGRLAVAIQLSQGDKKTIDDLKGQMEHAWKLTDASHAREQLAQEIIDNLRRQVENLNAEIEFRNKMSQEAEDGDAGKHKDGLERERDRLLNEVTQLNTKLANAVNYQEELERKTSDADLKINKYTAQIEDQTTQLNHLKRAKEKIDAEVIQLNYKLEAKETEINDQKITLELREKDNQRLELDLRELKFSYEKIVKELETANSKNGKLQMEYNNAVYEIEKNQKAIQDKMHEQKLQREETLKTKGELSKTVKVRDVLEKKVLAISGERDEIAAERVVLRHRMTMLEREIDELKRIIDEYKRGVESLNKDKEVLFKQIQRQQAVQADTQKLMHIQEQTKKKMELELDTFFIESNKQKKLLSQLERERDRLAEEQIELTQNVQDNLEDIREKKALIFDMKKTAAEQENYLRQQQNQYELMRSDRNALQKTLQESSAECSELKKKLKLLFHQIEQLKEDIGMKEKLLIKEENLMRKMAKEKENLKIEVMAGVDQIRKLKTEVKQQSEELKRLHKCIMDRNRVIKDQAKNIQQLLNMRDVIGSQLVRRNDEIALLNDKIVILQATLSRGETHYNQRLDDIRLLKLEIKRLRQEKNINTKSLTNMADLRQEIFHLERDLTKSRLKCKALEQEMQNPLNVHRWRKLEGSDPEMLELLQKVQLLQKRLLQQGSEAVERERQLRESERLYLNLRQLLAKQPGPQIQEELVKVRRMLKLRNDKLKCCVAERNMSELKVAEHKTDLQRITDELDELKKKYLAEKKAHRTLRMTYESSRELDRSRSAISNNEVKVTGGGFRMSVQKIPSK